MKKVSQGQVQIEGVPSYLGLAAKSDCSRSRNSGAYESQSRFWFQVRPPDLRYATDRGITWLSKCRVVVSTEKQATAADGALYDVKEDDPIAIRFAEGLSSAFSKVAMVVPDYATLEELFRLQAVLLSIRIQAPAAAEHVKLASFIPGHRYAHESPMPPSLPGLVNYHEATSTNGHSDGYTIHRYLTTVAGGVSMRIPVRPKSFRSDAGQTLVSFHRQILAARPAAHTLAWRAPPLGTSFFKSPLGRATILILACALFLKPVHRSPAAQATVGRRV
jgi:hypothetical protein